MDSINTTCLYTCNANMNYLRYIPLIVKNCLQMKFHPTILLINVDASYLVDFDEYNQYFIHLSFPNINDVYVSQIIRLFYPALLKDFKVVMINDIDLFMIPNKYFHDCIEHANRSNNFVAGRLKDSYYMGFNFAKPVIWKKMFQMNSYNDVKCIIYKIYEQYRKGNQISWGIDQAMLSKYIKKFQKNVKVVNIDKYCLKNIYENEDNTRTFKVQGSFKCNVSKIMYMSEEEMELFNHNDKLIFYTEAGGRDYDTKVIDYINSTYFQSVDTSICE